MASIAFDHEATQDLVSIIVPTYRKERFIGETLTSIGRQTYPNWELIVVEDGSEPRSEKIVRDFAAQHPNHRVDYSCGDRNYGAAQTRNKGFKRAAGEFVALLDSDDRWLPDHLEISVETLRTTGKDLVYSTVRMFEDQTDLALGVWGPDDGELRTFPYSLFRRNFVTPSATVMRRQVLADVGPWDGRFLYCEDADYWLRCVAASKSFQHIPGYHCLYRKNHACATTQRLCGTLEEFAEISAQYVDIPILDAKRCRKHASKAFLGAAEWHRAAHAQCDSSKDLSHVGPLMLKAWQLRPNHVDYLIKGSLLSMMHLLRRRKHESLPAPQPVVVALETAKLAA
jgi:glycosyltransferase involved in cell wall biosynthesis